MPVTLRVTNAGKKPYELYLRGRPIAFDIIVARSSGEIVWRRLEGQTIPAILQVRVLTPGESLELRDQWNQRTNGGELVGPGDYALRGALLTDAAQGMETGEVRLTIVAE